MRWLGTGSFLYAALQRELQLFLFFPTFFPVNLGRDTPKTAGMANALVKAVSIGVDSAER